MKMNFREKSENVTLLHSLILSYMQKIRKIQRVVFRENRGRERERTTERERERERERDGPEFKGPPDAIAKPSDQKTNVGIPRYPVTNGRTDGQTDNSESLGLIRLYRDQKSQMKT